MSSPNPTHDSAGKEYKEGFLRGYKIARLNEMNRPLPRCDADPHSDRHDLVDTGDPCWCGSDNCTICVICGDENHD